MSIVHLRRSDETVDRIIRAAFPDFAGRNVRAEISPTVRFWGTNWDEGNKRDYMIVRLADLVSMPVADAPFTQNSPIHDKDHVIADGFVVVVHVYSGQNDYVMIISPPTNVSALLPAPVELSPDEETVLIATRSLKSSYAGIKDYRFSEAVRYRGITRAAWDAARASMIAKGFLNRVGAITPEGRNAIGRKSF